MKKKSFRRRQQKVTAANTERVTNERVVIRVYCHLLRDC